MRSWMRMHWTEACIGLAAFAVTSLWRISHLASLAPLLPRSMEFKRPRSMANMGKARGGWNYWRIALCALPVLALFSSVLPACAQSTPSLVAASAYNAQPGSVPTGVVTGMFSSSGFLDFAVLEQNPNTGLDQVEIFHGNADGSFCTNCSGGTPDLIPLGPSGSTVRGNSIAVGQFRSSTGFLDIAVATNTGIVFLQNSGSGTFTRNDALTLSSGNSFTLLVAGMFKGDGNYDIAAVSPVVSGSVLLTIFIGDESGDFTPSAPYSVSNTYAQCTAIMQGNFQSQTTQSDLALLCSNPSEASVLVYLNNLDGSGNFTAGQIPYTGSAFGGTLPGVAVGTLNSQAAIFVSSVSSSFQSYQSNGLAGLSNVFTSVSMIPVGLAPRGSLAVLYDPSTGAVDFAVANNGVSLSTFTSYTASGTSIDGTWASTASLGPGNVLATGFSPNLTQGAAYVAIGAGVHDGTYPNFESYVDERSIGVFLAYLNPNGTVSATNAAPVYTGTGANGYSFPPSFATGDFNNDGILDLAVAGANDATGDATLTIYLANADGSINTTTSVPVITVNNTDYSGADAVVAGKFRPTQSGQTSPYYDLAVFSSGQVFVLLSTGDGTFGAQTSIPLSGDPNYPGFEYNPSAGYPFAPVLTATDVNGDGLDDIVLTLPEYNCNGSGAVSQGAVYVLISNGDGTFQSPVFVAPPVVNPVSVAAAKFYGTSVPDLVFADGGEFCSGNSATTTGTAVGILQNNVPANSSSVTASEFAAAVVLPQTSDLTVPNVTAVASADFNGDGQPDLVVSNTNGLQILLNQGGGVFAATTQGILPLYTGDIVPGPLCNSTGGYVGCVTYDSQVATGSLFAAGENDVAASVNGVAYVFQNQGAGILSAPTQGFMSGPNSTTISGALSNSNGLNGLLLATSQGTAYLMNGGAQPSPSYAMYSPTFINFGSVQVDSITTQQLTLTNTGGLPFNVTQIAVTGTQGFSLANAVCNSVTFSSSATLNAGASCIFTVQLAPTTVKQEIGGQITITDSAAVSNADGSGSGQIIFLGGTVVSIPTAATLFISPLTGTAGSPLTLTATVTTSSGNVGSFGTVTFYNGATVLGNSSVSGGIASIILSGGLAAGSYPISAVYQDSTNTYAASTSLTKVFLVIPVQLDPPQIMQAFRVPSIPLNGIASLTFHITNPNSSSTLSGVAFTDNFPSGLAIASPSNLTSSCGGANAGSASVTLSGATLPAAGSCTISLNVTGTSTGTFTNSVTVTSAQTPTGNTSAASLLIQAGLFSPTSGTRGETLNVTITGSGFVSGVTTVTFGSSTDGVTLNSVTVTDSGHLTANITISAAAKLGKLAITVVTGTSQLRPGNFVVQAPTLTVSPNSGTAGETLDVTLTGWTFPNGTTATFGNTASGITVNSVIVSPDASHAFVNITIASNAPKRGETVTVNNGQSNSSFLDAFAVKPVALVLTPNTGMAGETLDVTLAGWTFPSGTTVTFGNNASGITVNSVTVSPDATQAVANITIVPNAPERLETVSVNNGQGLYHFVNAFAVKAAALVLSPNTGTAGETVDVTLTSWTFPSGTTVTFGNSASGITVNTITVLDASEAIANITIASNAPERGEIVTVNDGQSLYHFVNAFAVKAPALVLSPNTGTAGETLNVTLTGATFLSGTTLTFGNSTSGITVNSVTVSPDATQAVANITIATNAPERGETVSVNYGQSLYHFLNAFAVKPAQLILTPNTGSAGETLNVTLTGWTFLSGTTVMFGNNASGITVNSVTVSPDATQALANITIALQAPRRGENVIVNNGQGNFNFLDVFTVVAP